MAQAAGHDINYIALAGVLHAIGRKGEAPVPPLNLVGDFGGGGMFLAFGVVCALLEAQKSGKGQVVDAAMVDGAAYLVAGIYGLYSQGSWADERGVNVIDSGAPWYDVYKTKDGKWLSVGAIEKRFYEELVEKLGLALGRAAQAARPQGLARAARALHRGDRLARRATNGSASSRAAMPASRPVLALGEVETPSPQRGARHLRAARRRAAAGPGAALLPHAMRDGRRRRAAARRRQRGRAAATGASRPAEIAELKKAGVVGAA